MPHRESSARKAAATPPTELFWRRLEPRDRPSRWRYPRVHANLPVRITSPKGKPVDLTSNDVSVLGVQVRCDRRTAVKLRPDPKKARDQEYALQIVLPFASKRIAVVAVARLAHISLVPNAPDGQEIAMGFQLKSFEGRGSELLERYVSRHLAD